MMLDIDRGKISYQLILVNGDIMTMYRDKYGVLIYVVTSPTGETKAITVGK